MFLTGNCTPARQLAAGRGGFGRVDPRWCYRGVAEVSIYIGERFRGRGLGYHLLTTLCQQAEAAGYWTLQSTVLQDNAASFRRVLFRSGRCVGLCGQFLIPKPPILIAVLIDRKSVV